MKFSRKAKAIWKGSGKEGKGVLTTGSKVLDDTQYSFKTRFEDGEKGTNPEELIGAAHAGCYAMQLSVLLSDEGHAPDSLDVDATVHFEDGIKAITLKMKAKVPGTSEDKFNELANKAKEICPVSQVLNADIKLESSFSN